MHRLLRLMENTAQDLRFAARTLAKTPGFTAVAILSIALGIGANTAIFSLIDAVMWRMLPVKDPQTLWSVAIKMDQAIDTDIYYKDYRAMREGSSAAELAGYLPLRINLQVDGNPEPGLDGELVAGNYFSLLGVTPVAGRTIGSEDDRVAMISYAYWRRRFALAPSAIGRAVSISGTVFTIIGVTPPEFFGVEVGLAPDVFVPLSMLDTVAPDRSGWPVLARLKPGIAPQQATAELDTLFRRAQPPPRKFDREHFTADGRKFHDATNGERHVTLIPAAAGLSALRRQFSQPLFLLMAAVAVVLLIACANIANLLLARAAARRPEFAMRLALGARPGRLTAQLLTESLVLSFAGAALGILLALWATKLLVLFLSTGQSPIALDLHPDLRVLSFTAAAAVVTGLLFGLAPALNSARIDLCSAMKGAVKVSARLRPGKILAVFQVALSLLLLIGAGLFVRSLQNLSRREASVPRESVSIIRIDARPTDWRDRPEWRRLDNAYKDLLRTVEEIPGVRSVSLAQVTPANPHPVNFEGLTIAGKVSEPIGTVTVFPGYFAIVGIPLVAGRDFTPADDSEHAPPVCVVNEAFVRKMYPGENAIGKPCFHSSRAWEAGSSTMAFEIVGVARDLREMNPTGTIPPMAYTTFLQIGSTRPRMALYIRMLGNTNAILPRIRSLISRIDPALPQLEIHTLARDMDVALIRERLIAILSGLFGILALLLASVGLYGLLAFAVVQRTMEVGIRMALGATRAGVLRMVMRDALRLVLAGIAVGVPVALASARVAASRFPGLFAPESVDPALAAVRTEATGVLFGVKATDPVTMAVAVVVLSAAGAVAAYLPARRASRVDPMVALRND